MTLPRGIQCKMFFSLCLMSFSMVSQKKHFPLNEAKTSEVLRTDSISLQWVAIWAWVVRSEQNIYTVLLRYYAVFNNYISFAL
jgi:hypothetical protein